MSMTLEQYLNGGSVWGSIQAIRPFPFFETNTALELDNQTVLNYGNRLLFSKIENKNIDVIAKNIVSLYGDSWDELIKIHAMDYSIGSNNTRKTTENINKTETRTNNREEISKVSAFNTDELINNDGSSVIGDDDLTGDTQRVVIDESINISSAFYNLSLIEKENIIHSVISDVAIYLTLDIY